MGLIIGDQIIRVVAQNKGVPKKTTISNNLRILDVTKQDLSIIGEKKQGAVFTFMFESSYGESESKIEIEGKIYYSGDKKELDEIENTWKTKKSLPEKIMLGINNRALEVSLLQSVALANQLRLPVPIQLPRFVPATEEAKKG